MRRRVFFYVQHLLGVGHVFRAARIARGLKDAGFEIDLVMGGVPVKGLDTAGFRVIQLPPLKAGPEGFSSLVTPTGEPADADIKARRTNELLAAFERSRPDVVLIEAFPFGRRQMRFELIPLLEAAHQSRRRPHIVSSVRDILQESSRPDRARETVAILSRYFDHVLVHGDPRMVTFDETFPLAKEIGPIVSYTGLVTPPFPDTGRLPNPASADVVVSAGGGVVGRRLLETAVAAKPMTRLASARWLVVAGPNAGGDWLDGIAASGNGAGLAVKRFVPDLASVLAGAKLSISQAGYNTVADILVAKCKAVLVPFAQGGETEQTRRAALLEKHGLAVVLDEQKLSADAMAAAVDYALGRRLPDLALDLNGARRTAACLLRLLTNTC